MANANPQPIVRNFSNPGSSSNLSGGLSNRSLERPERARPKSWEMRIGLTQVVILWTTMAVVMVMVFLFGLFAGRKQGLQAALDEQQSDTALRLPIEQLAQLEANPAQAIPTPPTTEARVKDGLAVPLGDAPAMAAAPNEAVKELPAETVQSKSAKEQEAADNLKFDFSAAAPIEVAEPVRGADQQARAKLQEPAPVVKPAEEAIIPAKTKSDLGTESGTPAPKVEQPVSKKLAPKAEPFKLESKPQTTKAKIADKDTVVKPSSGWYVQLAAVTSNSEATALVAKYKRAGFNPVIQRAKVNNVMYSRVVIGPFKSRDSAIESQKKVRRSGVAKGEPFLKYIG